MYIYFEVFSTEKSTRVTRLSELRIVFLIGGMYSFKGATTRTYDA